MNTNHFSKEIHILNQGKWLVFKGILSKVTLLKSVHSNEKDEVCHSFLVKIFTKSDHRGVVQGFVYQHFDTSLISYALFVLIVVLEYCPFIIHVFIFAVEEIIFNTNESEKDF